MNQDDQKKLQSMWKVFGMETSLGKQFYNMYNKDKRQVKIEYPPIKRNQKLKDIDPSVWNKTNPIEKPKVEIEYPPLEFKQKEYVKDPFLGVPKRRH